MSSRSQDSNHSGTALGFLSHVKQGRKWVIRNTALSFLPCVKQGQGTLDSGPVAPLLSRELRRISLLQSVPPRRVLWCSVRGFMLGFHLVPGSADQAQLAVEARSALHFLRKTAAPGSGTKPLDCPICLRMCIDVTRARRLRLNLFCRQKYVDGTPPPTASSRHHGDQAGCAGHQPRREDCRSRTTPA